MFLKNSNDVKSWTTATQPFFGPHEQGGLAVKTSSKYLGLINSLKNLKLNKCNNIIIKDVVPMSLVRLVIKLNENRFFLRGGLRIMIRSVLEMIGPLSPLLTAICDWLEFFQS